MSVKAACRRVDSATRPLEPEEPDARRHRSAHCAGHQHAPDGSPGKHSTNHRHHDRIASGDHHRLHHAVADIRKNRTIRSSGGSEQRISPGVGENRANRTFQHLPRSGSRAHQHDIARPLGTLHRNARQQQLFSCLQIEFAVRHGVVPRQSVVNGDQGVHRAASLHRAATRHWSPAASAAAMPVYF